MRPTEDCSPSQRKLLQEDGACDLLVVGSGCSPTPHTPHPTPAPTGLCQNSFIEPATLRPTPQVPIPPQLNTVSVSEARRSPAGEQSPADEEPLARLGETVTIDSNPVTLKLAETIDLPLTLENTEVENNKDSSLTQSEGLLSGSFRPEDQVCLTLPGLKTRGFSGGFLNIPTVSCTGRKTAANVYRA